LGTSRKKRRAAAAYHFARKRRNVGSSQISVRGKKRRIARGAVHPYYIAKREGRRDVNPRVLKRKEVIESELRGKRKGNARRL